MSHTLLIIEDDASLNQMLQLHFEDAGYRVEGVKSCTGGLELLRKSAFDLILLDQQLPDGPGLELLRRLCSEDPGQAIVMMATCTECGERFPAKRSDASCCSPSCRKAKYRRSERKRPVRNARGAPWPIEWHLGTRFAV